MNFDIKKNTLFANIIKEKKKQIKSIFPFHQQSIIIFIYHDSQGEKKFICFASKKNSLSFKIENKKILTEQQQQQQNLFENSQSGCETLCNDFICYAYNFLFCFVVFSGLLLRVKMEYVRVCLLYF